MRITIALSATVAAFALVATGCGGSDSSDEDPTAAWASSFCTAITSWTDELQTVTSQFSDTSNLSEDGLRSAADDVQSATSDLVDDLERARGSGNGVGRGDPVRARLALHDARVRSRQHRGDGRGDLRPHRDSERDHSSDDIAVGDEHGLLGDVSDDRGRRRGQRAADRTRGLSRVRRHHELRGSAHVGSRLDGLEVAMHVLNDDRSLPHR